MAGRRGMRKARIIRPNATYHVTAKTNRGEFLLEPEEVKELFSCVVNEAREKYCLQLIQFVIMSNHVHLLIKPAADTNLSKLMQWILSVFAVRFNKMYGFKGHVWYDRFKSKIVASFRQLVNTFNYITDNPVKAGLCQKGCDYHWGGMYELKRGRFRLLDPPEDWLKLLVNIS